MKNIKLEDGMSVEEFKEYCRENDWDKVEKWDFNKFKVTCNSCNNSDIEIFYRGESGAMGSEYTGYMRGFNHYEGMLIKCKSCGKIMDLDLPMQW